MRYEVKGTNASGQRETRYYSAQHPCDAIAAALEAGLYHPVDARPRPVWIDDANSNHAVRLEMQHTPNWGQA